MKDYETRVRELEREGLTRSDAQGVADLEFKDYKKIAKKPFKPNKTREYLFYTDTAHGWLEVPLKELARYGWLEKVSDFSYMDLRTGKAYLEEDCDAPAFIKHAGITKHQILELQDESCLIRELPRYELSRVRYYLYKLLNERG